MPVRKVVVVRVSCPLPLHHMPVSAVLRSGPQGKYASGSYTDEGQPFRRSGGARGRPCTCIHPPVLSFPRFTIIDTAGTVYGPRLEQNTPIKARNFFQRNSAKSKTLRSLNQLERDARYGCPQEECAL